MSGGLYGLEPPGQGRLNKKSILIDTGANIAAIPLTSPATVFVCTADGAGFKQDQMYLTRADGSGRKAIMQAHDHSTSADEKGGDIYDIDVNNDGTRIAFQRMTKGGFFVVSIESGTVDATRISNDKGTNSMYTALKTTATTGDKWTLLEDGGGQLSFANRITWKIKMQIDYLAETPPNITWRAGVNMEAISAAGTGTENRFGMEGCGVSDVFTHLICANGGGTRTNVNTGINMNIGMRGYAMTYTPGTSIVWKDSAGNIQSLTSNVPSTGTIASDRLLRYGVRKATGTVAKAMYISMDALYGKLGDPNWVV
jgi:hypothetical protein